MTTFGNPYDNQYHSTSVQTGKSKRAASQNQKEARKQKKSKAKGNKVDKGTKGGYKGSKGGRSGGGGGGGRGGGGGGGFWGGGGSSRNSDRGGGGGGDGGGGGGAGADIGGGFVGILQIVCLAAAVGQLVVGIIHTVNLFESLDNICNDDNPGTDCVGDSLFWHVENPLTGEELCNVLTLTYDPVTNEAIGGSFVGTDATTCNEDNAGYSSWLNSAWRAQVFSLVPDIFADNWTPLIFGLLAIFQCIGGMQSDWISGSLLKCLIFHIIMMLFACFGYAGQAGIVIGFIEAFAALLILIGMLMRIGGYAYPTFYLGCC